MEQHDLDQELERLKDNYSIHTILCSLQRVCEEKAAYVAGGGSHGDPSPYMAKRWRGIAKRMVSAQRDAAGL